MQTWGLKAIPLLESFKERKAAGSVCPNKVLHLGTLHPQIFALVNSGKSKDLNSMSFRIHSERCLQMRTLWNCKIAFLGQRGLIFYLLFLHPREI